MKKVTLIILLVLMLTGNIFSLGPDTEKLSFGVLFMGGGRYDDLRMCVGSDAGVKGGPMADIQLVVRYSLSPEYAVLFKLPVMRPILFGTAFKVLQFEPEFTLEFRNPINDDLTLVTGPGLGVSLHYGPDYKSDLNNRGDDFFAVGPYISMMAGLSFGGMTESGNVLGLRAIYVPLFSKEYPTGTVLGGALEYTMYF